MLADVSKHLQERSTLEGPTNKGYIHSATRGTTLCKTDLGPVDMEATKGRKLISFRFFIRALHLDGRCAYRGLSLVIGRVTSDASPVRSGVSPVSG